jgi:polyhydroxybutyrate depolymerase
VAIIAVLAASLTWCRGSSARTSGPSSTAPASASAVPGVPDVTGLGTGSGAVSVATLQAANPAVTITVSSLLSGGLDRGYLLITPTAATAPVPLIVALHGVNASATQEAQRDELLPLVSAGKVAVVYPAGYAESWNVGAQSCCGAASRKGVDDVAFIAAVVAAVDGQVSVASGQTFLLGFSNGGKMAYQALTQPARAALIASGALDPELPTSDAPEPAVDAVFDVATLWRLRDDCTGQSVRRLSGSATIDTWAACTNGTSVTTVLYSTLAHVWPSASLVGATQSAAAVIWKFFAAQLTQ